MPDEPAAAPTSPAADAAAADAVPGPTVTEKATQRVAERYVTNSVPVIVVGTIGWLIALIVLVAIGNDTYWRWVCLTGFGLGVVGVPVIARYQRVHG